MLTKNAALHITADQANRTIESLYNEVMARKDRSGLPIIFFISKSEKYPYEEFRIILEQFTNRKFSIRATLDGFISHQVENEYFERDTPISVIFARMSGFDSFESYLDAGRG